MTINWKQVLEIETYLTNIFEQNFGMEKFLWRHPETVNSGLRVDKTKLYSFDDLQNYLTTKFPEDKMLRNGKEATMQLFLVVLSGVKLCNIDDELFDINENQELFRLSDETLKTTLLSEGAEYTGFTSFFLYCLKVVTDSFRNELENLKIDSTTREQILSNFINYINQFEDFNSGYFSTNTNVYNLDIKSSDFIKETYKKLEEKTHKFTGSAKFKSYLSSCEENNYLPPYSESDFEILHKDLMLFSINEVIEIIKKEDENYFGFKLRNNGSPYPTDLRRSNYGNLSVHITLYGLLNYDVISEFKANGLLLETVKKILSTEFTILTTESISDSYNPEVTMSGNRLNSSLILGKDIYQKKLYSQYIDDYQEKVMSGFAWFHNDLHSITYNYLGFHDESDFKGEYKHSIPFENIIFKYFIAYLEKTEWERKLGKNTQKEGYWLSKDEFENKTSDEYDDWDSEDDEDEDNWFF